jgi:prepilin-type N-terminal cleavage/methylation domain-containing protein
MYWRGRSRKLEGFTIVELLIVIVVIAILAAIVIVTYQGVQQRADNSRIMEAARFYQKAITAYMADHGGALPTGLRVCLGNGYPSNQCWNGPNGTLSVDATTDANLAPYINGQKPTPSTRVLQITGAPDYRLGILLDATQSILVYYLEGGGQTCLDNYGGATEMQGTQCHITLTAP